MTEAKVSRRGFFCVGLTAVTGINAAAGKRAATGRPKLDSSENLFTTTDISGDGRIRRPHDVWLVKGG
jgi:hypothetical protein